VHAKFVVRYLVGHRGATNTKDGAPGASFLRETCAQAAAHGLCREAPGILDTAGNGQMPAVMAGRRYLMRCTPVTTAPGNMSMTVRRASADDSACGAWIESWLVGLLDRSA
jgi:hypothetical protein